MKEKKKKEIKLNPVKANSKVLEIVNDYPEELIAAPRPSFEHQLTKHLLKHGIK